MILLEGLTRWNEDRGKAAAGGAGINCYSGQQQYTLHQLTQHFFHTTMVESHVKPLQYTGELIGISYLYNQTGKVLQPLPDDPDVPDDSEEGTEEEEEEEEEEGYDGEDFFHLPPPRRPAAPAPTTPPAPHSPPPPPPSPPPAPLPPPRRPAAPIAPRRPAAPIAPRRPAAPLAPRRPAAPLAPRRPAAPIVPRHPAAPLAPRRPAAPLPPPRRPAAPLAPRRPAAPIAPRRPAAPLAPTTPAAPPPPPPSPPSPPPAPRSPPQLQQHPPPLPGPSHQATAGTVGAPGHQQVDQLAQALVELCEKGYVTQEEVEVLLGLWENLLDVDKGRVVYPSRYRAQLPHGGFKKSKTSTANKEAVPELESMKRCMVGTGRATWPDTSRLVEAIFILLCQQNPSSRTTWGFLRSRWALVIAAYDQLRATVYSCPEFVTRTTLQLFGVNQQTLSQWHKRWTSAQENIILTAGIHALQAPRAAEEALLPEREIEDEEPRAEEPRAEEPRAEEPRAEEPLPGPGTAIFQELLPVEEEEPFPATPSCSSSSAPPSCSSSSAPPSSSSSYTPKSTAYNRLRLQEKQAEAARRGESLTLRPPSQAMCSSCGLRKIKETGHRNLVKASGDRVSYCPVLAQWKSPEEWLDSLQ